MPDQDINFEDLHPETQRLLSRRSFLGAAGAGGALTFMGMTVIGCSSTSSTSTNTTAAGAGGASTTASAGSAGTATKGSAAAGSLYQQLGGNAAITAVVAAFLKNVGGDTRINKRFANTDLAKLQTSLVNQIGQATGGPEKYTGPDMKKVHAGMAITAADFNALVEDLVKGLDQYNVPKDVQQPLLTTLAGMQPDIVTA